ncbi:MAG TPA: Dam family site-specific DNA-(adenine-N6)-methyltransferase [Pyrinomonadaceae bacterium]|nr:Dam family site-specific DNA-(adenine-N6)-methyltransferase [Pyrinomonadaceae bacterium]
MAINELTVAAPKTIKPPLKWAGGKRWLVPHLATIWERHAERRYVEPFCGGLAVALGLQPKRALLNDVNPHLINFYRHLQNGLTLRIDMRYDEQLFYQHRARFNELIKNGGASGEEAAELFYYLNRTCFNGLCRFNKSGEFNVPFGTYNAVNYDADFSNYPAVLRDWTFTNVDVEKVPVKRGDFVYADPPYDVEFTTYSSGGFSWDDQQRTAEFLAKHDGPVVISNQATPRIVKLYRQLGFHLSYLPGPRRISCTGDRTAAREVLAVK